MKRLIFFICVTLAETVVLKAQVKLPPAPAPVPAARNHSVFFQLDLPLGAFHESHFGGLGIGYTWARGRFGPDITGRKLIGFTASAGADYYFGQSVTTAGYPFRYKGYTYLHALAGIIHNFSAAAAVSLMAGPTLGLYDGHTDAGLGVQLSGNYFFTERIAIGPGLMYGKHADAAALWKVAIRASYAF